jgi:UDP-N-acetylmuramate--alanine ligase
MCTDHPEVQALVSQIQDRRIITYGLNPQADVRAVNIRTDAEGSTYDVVMTHDGMDETLRDVRLPMPGQHNVQNSLAALAIAQEMKIPVPLMKRAMETFSGVKRRFTKTGEAGGVTVIDDYGHHPVEIAAVLKAARSVVEGTDGRVIAVMQPHRYSRLSGLFDQFCTCFNDADTVIVADVYAAGEEKVEGADRAHLAEGLRSHGHRDVRDLAKPEDLAKMIVEIAREGDYVICLGAGDITKWAYALPGEMEKLMKAGDKQRA